MIRRNSNERSLLICRHIRLSTRSDDARAIVSLFCLLSPKYCWWCIKSLLELVLVKQEIVDLTFDEEDADSRRIEKKPVVSPPSSARATSSRSDTRKVQTSPKQQVGFYLFGSSICIAAVRILCSKIIGVWLERTSTSCYNQESKMSLTARRVSSLTTHRK